MAPVPPWTVAFDLERPAPDYALCSDALSPAPTSRTVHRREVKPVREQLDHVFSLLNS